MKRFGILWLPVLLALLIAGCGPVASPTATEPSPRTEEETKEALSGTVTLSGAPRPDEDVAAQVNTPQFNRVALAYEWFLDGEALAGETQKTLRVPVTASGKKLKCRVTDQSGVASGCLESEETTVEGTAAQPYSMAGLWQEIKPIGRVTAKSGGGMTVDWPGSGFEIRLNGDGSPLTLSVRSDTAIYYVTSVDGGAETRVYMPKGTMDLTVAVPAGEHLVRVVRDTGVSTSSNTAFLSLSFGGTLAAKPEDRPLLIEYIGDSICSGSGSLGKYQAGKAWTNADHSVTHAFSYLSAAALGADYSIVSRGGIGLLAAAGDHTMPEIYAKTCGYRSMTEDYDFASARKPDLIILELGANDGKAYPEDDYFKALADFVRLLREKWGEGIPIVWTGRSESHLGSMESLIRVRKKTDQNLYAFFYVYGGSGSAALATQTSGHPSAAEQKAYADALVEFLKENQLV